MKPQNVQKWTHNLSGVSLWTCQDLSTIVNQISPAEQQRRRAVYDRTRTDQEAAQQLGLSVGGFRGWRMRTGLPARGAPTTSPEEYWTKLASLAAAQRDLESDAYLDAYRRTANDVQAANELGVTASAYRWWRTQHGLPPKQPFRLSPAERQRRTQAWTDHDTIVDAAQSLGLSTATFQEWIRNEGLLAKRRYAHTVRPESRDERYLRAYQQARNDAEAAHLLKVPESAFRRWRNKNRLPPTSRHHARTRPKKPARTKRRGMRRVHVS